MKRLILGLALLAALAMEARAASRVSVQPFEGELGPDLRKQVVKILRGHGFRVVTSIARVQGTGQYLTLAKDNRLAAFVTGDLEERRNHASITFLIWNGANGSVLGRWSASAPSKKLPKAIAKGFWKRLKQAFEDAAPPAVPKPMDEAPPMFVDAAGN